MMEILKCLEVNMTMKLLDIKTCETQLVKETNFLISILNYR